MRAIFRVSLPLVLLTAVPMIAGVFRLHQLATGAPVTEENARFFASPVPVVVHIVGATLFLLLGAFQFVPSLRRRGNRWHRITGRALVPLGLAAAGSGLWMTVFYPKPVGDGPLLTGMRLVFGTGMAVSLVLGLRAILRREPQAHSAWMIRGYALGQGAGTQVLTNVPWVLAFGTPGELPRALLMGAGWVINLAVAEWIIRRPRRRRVSAVPVPAATVMR